ncbi:MAG: hypothetical protein CME59_01855 [Halioglobus sp.]|nr:hypothetical protein [Halioglobus sp.]|tara:strand:+ start:162 stop:956 length:795 start_codon:yes stop_codon:yes gene_type:complete
MGQFDSDTAVERVQDNLYRGEVAEGWRVGSVPNGGYLLAIAGRALGQALPHADPLSVNAFFLAPADLGPIECRIEVLRVGGSTSFAEAGLYQSGELKVKVTAAYTDLDALQGENWTAVQRPACPPWDACEASPQKGLEFRKLAELRLVSGRQVFTERRADGSGEFLGWLAHGDGADADALSLLMFADAMPPPVFTVLGPVGWVPTVEITVQVRARPAPGPLLARVSCRHLTRGVVEEDGEIWDSAGNLVAISRQTAKARLPRKK